ncbi:phage regulatory protein/antirepressor Ant [Clostridioides sp. ES-S-0049-02]|uniref:Rha family transcriptional regulator n=1 Tax=Clostridioides sp. ES-S-0049-02 TaxID=2770778 RepID=UPI001D120D61
MNKIVIKNVDGKLLVTSREIAENFKKQHKNVIQSIENIKAENSALTKMFVENSYIAGTGKSYKEYLITRDGFTLLVMSFTGTEALNWKLKYIEAFNKMEQMLKEQRLDLPTTYKEALQHLLVKVEENEKLQIENEEMKPKASYHDKVLNPEKLVITTDIAKDLGMSAQGLNALLYTNKIIYPVKKNGRTKCWKPYKDYQWLIPEYADFKISEYDTQLKWTEIGRKWLIEFVENIKKIS